MFNQFAIYKTEYLLLCFYKTVRSTMLYHFIFSCSENKYHNTQNIYIELIDFP